MNATKLLEHEIAEWVMDHVHDLIPVPQNAVVVEICSRVEPEVDPLLPAADAVGKHIGLQDVGLARCVA